VFHININITGQDICPALAPVPLNNLEELSLRYLSPSLYNVLLPLLAPGPKPLQLTFQTQLEPAAPLYCPTILSFFQRTNVTSLYILNRSFFNQPLTIDQLLTESPIKLHTLGLERLSISELEPSQLDRIKLPPPMPLDRLYLRKCTIGTDALKKLAEILSVPLLKLHEPEFQGLASGGEMQVREKIDLMFPTVKWVRSSRDMEDWNALEVEYIEVDEFKQSRGHVSSE
ncbi:hypothetical protein FRC11_013043, partial [Ceratobasidium sp. 423]